MNFNVGRPAAQTPHRYRAKQETWLSVKHIDIALFFLYKQIFKQMKNILYITIILSLCLSFVHCKSDSPTSPGYPDHELFTKHPVPVWEGKWLAGDPSIIKLEDKLLMYYTALVISGDGDGDNPDNLQVIIGVAESQDGISWDFSNPLTYGESVALENNTSSWDKILETAFAIKKDDEIFLYYTGYSEGVDGVNTIVAEGKIGLATSSDGLPFERYSDAPLLLPDRDFDADGLFSPTIAKYDGTFYMIYTGWSLNLFGYGLFGATSEDGINWTKQGELLIKDTDVTWAMDNPRESELVAGPDGMFYLFFTSDIAQNESAIGIARSGHPLGPWDIYQEPLVFKTKDWEESGLIAPAVLIEDDKIRMWYMAETGGFSNFYIGYAEIEFPDW